MNLKKNNYIYLINSPKIIYKNKLFNKYKLKKYINR